MTVCTYFKLTPVSQNGTPLAEVIVLIIALRNRLKMVLS
jgi:hypothetical protein